MASGLADEVAERIPRVPLVAVIVPVLGDTAAAGALLA